MKRILAAAVLSTMLLLSLGAVVAHADPTFLLSRSEAKRGEVVMVSISGTEEDADYTLEIGDRVVAEGSDPAGNGVSRGFIMPDLGDTSITVTVEAQVTQSDETTILTRSLQYLPPGAVTDPSGTQPAPASTPPALQPAPASRATPRSQGREHRPSRRPARRRRARRSPRRPREPAANRQRSTSGGNRPGGRGAPPPTRRRDVWEPGDGSDPFGTARSTEDDGHPSKAGSKEDAAGDRRSGAPTRLRTFLTGPPGAPGIFSPAPAVAGNAAGLPVAAVVVPALLGLAALALAGARVPRRRRRAYVPGGDSKDDDDEILRGTVHVPRP